MRDELRLENRKAFANIWSDMVYGIVLFLLIYFNESKVGFNHTITIFLLTFLSRAAHCAKLTHSRVQVALLKFTGYKLLNNISDSGKAFLIILVTDIFLG
jgi:CemA family